MGDKPKWANDKINLIPRSTEWSEKDTVRNSNYCGAILTAALQNEITDDFLCINDDHYLLCPLRVEDIKLSVPEISTSGLIEPTSDFSPSSPSLFKSRMASGFISML